MRRPAYEEITSVSVEPRATRICFLHIQLKGTNVRLPKIQRIHPKSILSLQDLQQNQNLGTICIDNAEPCFTNHNFVGDHLCDECKVSSEASVTSSCPFLASLFTDQRMSSLPSRAKSKRFKTICEHTLDNSPTVSNSSFFELMTVKTWCGDLIQLLDCLVCQYISSHVPSMSWDNQVTFAPFSPIQVTFSDVPVQIRDSNIFYIREPNLC